METSPAPKAQATAKQSEDQAKSEPAGKRDQPPAPDPATCKGLRAATKSICGDLVAGKSEGLRCSQAVGLVYRGQDCERWVQSLERQWQETKNRFDPWSWGPKCQGYLESLGKECLSPMDGLDEVPDTCQKRYQGVTFELEKMLRVPGNKHFAAELEKHCAAQSDAAGK